MRILLVVLCFKTHLVVVSLELGLNSLLELDVVNLRRLHTREQIRHNGVEQRQVNCRHLRHIHVLHSQQQDLLVAQRRVIPLDLSRMPQHGRQGAQAEVVVVLFGQLLCRQLVQGVHLLSQRPRVIKALAEEQDLGDVVRVRHAHADRPEHGLEIVGELSAASVARVHGDEDAAGGHEPHHAFLDVAGGRAGGEGLDNGHDLLCHHGQHLDVDAVELVETAPGACLGKATEVAAHRLVVEALRAVDHDNVHAQRFAQVLDGLGLAGAGGALGRATAVVLQGCGERHVAAVGEWGDDQAT